MRIIHTACLTLLLLVTTWAVVASSMFIFATALALAINLQVLWFVGEKAYLGFVKGVGVEPDMPDGPKPASGVGLDSSVPYGS